MRQVVAAGAVALAMAACGAKVEKVYVPVEPVRQQAPAECTAADPAYPRLPDGDADQVTMIRDRVMGKSRYREVLRRRAVCRAWIVKVHGPAPVAGVGAGVQVAAKR